jgi:hypothetical protein
VENGKTLNFPENIKVVNNLINSWITIQKEKNSRCPSTEGIYKTW